MKFYTRVLSFVLAVSSLVPNVTRADPEGTKAQRIEFNNSVYDIILDPQDAGLKRLILWGESKGNFSQMVRVSVGGPGKMKGTVEAKYVRAGVPLEQAAVSDDGWYQIELRNQNNKKSGINIVATSSAMTLPISSALRTSAASAGDTEQLCKALSGEALKTAVDYFNKRYGTNFTVAEYCQKEEEYFKNNIPKEDPTGSASPSPSPSASPGGDEPWWDDNAGGLSDTDPLVQYKGYSSDYGVTGLLDGVFSKNACLSSSSGSYLLRVVLDFNAVSPNTKAENYQVIAAVQTYAYKGSRAASLKPQSDGKYNGAPIILVAALAGSSGLTGNEEIRAQRFTKGRPTTYASTSQIDYIFYNGVFARAPASKMLTGGRVNVEYQSGDAIYSVCINATRTRQNINGYQGPKS